MINTVLIIYDKKLAFQIYRKEKVIYIYDAHKSLDTKVLLKIVDSKLAEDIESNFEIDIKDYGVIKDDSMTYVFNEELILKQKEI